VRTEALSKVWEKIRDMYRREQDSPGLKYRRLSACVVVQGGEHSSGFCSGGKKKGVTGLTQGFRGRRVVRDNSFYWNKRPSGPFWSKKKSP